MRQLIPSNVLLLGAVAVVVLIVVLGALLAQVRAARRGAGGRHAAPEGGPVGAGPVARTSVGEPTAAVPAPLPEAPTAAAVDAVTVAGPPARPTVPDAVRDAGLAELPARYHSLLHTGEAPAAGPAAEAGAADGHRETDRPAAEAGKGAPVPAEGNPDAAVATDEIRPVAPVPAGTVDAAPATGDTRDAAPPVDGSPQTTPPPAETRDVASAPGSRSNGTRAGATPAAVLDAVPYRIPGLRPPLDDLRAVEPPPIAPAHPDRTGTDAPAADVPRNGVARRGDTRDRLLAVLLDDPAAAVRAVDDLEMCEGRIARLTAAVRQERAALAEVLRRLAGAGLGHDQLVRLTRLPPDEVHEVLAGTTPAEPTP